LLEESLLVFHFDRRGILRFAQIDEQGGFFRGLFSRDILDLRNWALAPDVFSMLAAIGIYGMAY
jgi:hypothetical protein